MLVLKVGIDNRMEELISQYTMILIWRFSSKLLNDVVCVTIVGEATAAPADGARVHWASFPLIPYLDTLVILTDINSCMTTVRSTGERGDCRSVWQLVSAYAISGFPCGSTTLEAIGKCFVREHGRTKGVGSEKLVRTLSPVHFLTKLTHSPQYEPAG